MFVSVVWGLLWKPAGMRPLGRLNCREDTIKVDLQEVGWGIHWIDRDSSLVLVNAVMNFRVP